jgi:hypothetical protein
LQTQATCLIISIKLKAEVRYEIKIFQYC